MSPIRSTLEAATCSKSETNNKRTLIVEKLTFFNDAGNRCRHHLFPIGLAATDFSEYFARQNTEAVFRVVIKVIDAASVEQVTIQLL